MSHVHKTMTSPVGTLGLVAGDLGLVAVLWERDGPRRVPLDPGPRDDRHPLLVDACRQLDEYFAGERKDFNLTLQFAGTDFQKNVWRVLLEIPYGATTTYGDIAGRVGSPRAVRAVGAAIGKNPISIIGPCHRVIGASGKLTGFAGGLDAKAFLLRLERGHPDASPIGMPQPARRSASDAIDFVSSK